MKNMENFEQIIANAKRESEMGRSETSKNRAIRHLAEINGDLNRGLQSPAEARALIAKLDLIIESVNDEPIEIEAQEVKDYIVKRYGKNLLDKQVKQEKNP